MPERRLQTIVITLLLVAAVPATADQHFRDPTRPYTARPVVATTPSAFKVNALIVSDERRLAIVNGRRVGIGDTIGGATVTNITRHELTLDVDGEPRTLRLSRAGSR